MLLCHKIKFRQVHVMQAAILSGKNDGVSGVLSVSRNLCRDQPELSLLFIYTGALAA